MNDTTLVQIKGMRDGLLVSLGDAGWPVVQRALIERIEEQPAFFQGARLALDVGGQTLKSAELAGLRDKLSEHGIMLWAVLSVSPVTENTAQILGLATRLSKPRPHEQPAARKSDEDGALWINKTIRSGTRIEHAGHVVILGDVNPGAEVIAGGSVIVWGRLRGVVHAGATGNQSAVVCALDLSPTQLRIAGEIAMSPERRGKPAPEIVCLKDGQLQAETWTPG
jgi:septum site-determining protein MinC